MLMFGSLMPGKMASGKISENLMNRFRKDSKELILGPKMTGVKKKKEKKRKTRVSKSFTEISKNTVKPNRKQLKLIAYPYQVNSQKERNFKPNTFKKHNVILGLYCAYILFKMCSSKISTSFAIT